MNVSNANHSSGGRGRRGRRSAGKGLDFELNLASVIDCLVVLIAFVLVSTSFFSIGVLEGEVTASSAASSPSNEEPGMVVALKRNHSIEVSVHGGRSRGYVIQAEGGNWDFDALADRLALIKGQEPKVSSAVLVAENGVAYRDVIKSMELTRLAVPSVLLGGY